MCLSKNKCSDQVGGPRELGLHSTELVHHWLDLAHHLDLWLLSHLPRHGGESYLTVKLMHYYTTCHPMMRQKPPTEKHPKFPWDPLPPNC